MSSGQGALDPSPGEPAHLAPGAYVRNAWIDTKTGRRLPAPATRVSSGDVSTKEAELQPDERRVGTKAVRFVPPGRETDWVLLLRTDEK